VLFFSTVFVRPPDYSVICHQVIFTFSISVNYSSFIVSFRTDTFCYAVMTRFAHFIAFHDISPEVFIALFALLPLFSNFPRYYSYLVAMCTRCVQHQLQLRLRLLLLLLLQRRGHSIDISITLPHATTLAVAAAASSCVVSIYVSPAGTLVMLQWLLPLRCLYACRRIACYCWCTALSVRRLTLFTLRCWRYAIVLYYPLHCSRTLTATHFDYHCYQSYGMAPLMFTLRCWLLV